MGWLNLGGNTGGGGGTVSPIEYTVIDTASRSLDVWYENTTTKTKVIVAVIREPTSTGGDSYRNFTVTGYLLENSVETKIFNQSGYHFGDADQEHGLVTAVVHIPPRSYVKFTSLNYKGKINNTSIPNDAIIDTWLEGIYG